MLSTFGSRIITKKCIVCGKEFQTTLPMAKTCSLECSMINKQNYSETLKKNNNRYYSKVRKSKNMKVK